MLRPVVNTVVKAWFAIKCLSRSFPGSVKTTHLHLDTPVFNLTRQRTDIILSSALWRSSEYDCNGLSSSH